MPPSVLPDTGEQNDIWVTTIGIISLFSYMGIMVIYKKKEIASKELTNEVNKIYNDSIFNGFAISIVNEKGILYRT